jgi:hypothetical protein
MRLEYRTFFILTPNFRRQRAERELFFALVWIFDNNPGGRKSRSAPTAEGPESLRLRLEGTVSTAAACSRAVWLLPQVSLDLLLTILKRSALQLLALHQRIPLTAPDASRRLIERRAAQPIPFVGFERAIKRAQPPFSRATLLLQPQRPRVAPDVLVPRLGISLRIGHSRQAQRSREVQDDCERQRAADVSEKRSDARDEAFPHGAASAPRLTLAGSAGMFGRKSARRGRRRAVRAVTRCQPSVSDVAVNRQLRQLHIQPLPLFGRAGCGNRCSAQRCAKR